MKNVGSSHGLRPTNNGSVALPRGPAFVLTADGAFCHALPPLEAMPGADFTGMAPQAPREKTHEAIEPTVAGGRRVCACDRRFRQRARPTTSHDDGDAGTRGGARCSARAGCSCSCAGRASTGRSGDRSRSAVAAARNRHANAGAGCGRDGDHAQWCRQRRQKFPRHQWRFETTAFLSEQRHQSFQRQRTTRRLDFPDRCPRVAGDLADRRQRRDVCHHVVRPRLRAQCADRRDVLALQAQYGADHDLLLRPQQSRRRGLSGQGLCRHARCHAGGARRQDRQCGVETADRRSDAGLQRNHGADRGRRQNPDRHQRRRIRHPRLRQSLRRH